MPFLFVDYSREVVSSGAAARSPRRSSGKFIQVSGPDGEFLVISLTADTPFHANIAERFFGERSVSGEYNKKRHHFRLLEDDWRIVGGGTWELDAAERSFRLSGSSLAYGRYDARRAERQLAAAPQLAGFRIVCE